MIASLPMYRLPGTEDAWDRLWHLTRDHLGFGPERLSHPEDLHTHWRDPELLLSQTCSLPYRMGLHAHVHLVGAFDFDLPDTPPGHYHSVIIARLGDLPDAPKAAINAYNSQSGFAALCDWLGHAPEDPLVTGAHAASARAVAKGEADIAALDAVTWALLPDTRDLRVVARTAPTPGLPLITADPNRALALQAALASALEALSAADRAQLRLHGVVPCSKSAYLALPLPASMG